MSKNVQRNKAEINLGNETYDRGYADGLAGRPKSIKKSHRHAHRYHAGYRNGERTAASERRVNPNTVILEIHGVDVPVVVHGEGAKAIQGEKPGFWTRCLRLFGL